MKPDPYRVPPDAHFKPPWLQITAAEDARRYTDELLSEAPHLTPAEPHAIARNTVTDEVLLWFAKPNEVRAGGFPFAVVSLSPPDAAQHDLSCRLEYFECWSHWVDERMER